MELADEIVSACTPKNDAAKHIRVNNSVSKCLMLLPKDMSPAAADHEPHRSMNLRRGVIDLLDPKAVGDADKDVATVELPT